tara:strand:+ start:212 stop:388 length:177 start_codon:yes stop_codon:yes gene_type:complete
MKKLGQITGILLIIQAIYWILNNLGVIDFVMMEELYSIFNIAYILLGVFIFLLSSKLK